MKTLAVAVLFLSVVLGLTPAAHAQSAYVAAALGADVARAGSSDDATGLGTGEAMSFSLRVGTPVASRFGVELDFTRPSKIERDDSPEFRILTTAIPSISSSLPLVGGTAAPTVVFPDITYRVHTEQRTTTLTAGGWAQQELGRRISLVYLAGMAFSRVDRRYDYSFTVRPPIGYLAPTIFPPSSSSKQAIYGVGPMAGIEARVGLTDHVQLIPGTRLLAQGGEWIVRPAIALAWKF